MQRSFIKSWNANQKLNKFPKQRNSFVFLVWNRDTRYLITKNCFEKKALDRIDQVLISILHITLDEKDGILYVYFCLTSDHILTNQQSCKVFMTLD